MSPESLHRVLSIHGPAIEAIVRRYVDDPADRDDLRQEIAVALWRALPRFLGHSSEQTYALRIARNRAVTFCLRLARKRALLRELDAEYPSPVHISGEFELAALRSRLQGMIDRLPPAHRRILVLTAAGFTPRQIADATGREAGAVRVALHRIRRVMRGWIGDAEGRYDGA